MIALKLKSVLAGYKLLIRCTDCLISAAVIGQRGWAGICLTDAAIGAYDIWSVDMMAMFSEEFSVNRQFASRREKTRYMQTKRKVG